MSRALRGSFRRSVALLLLLAAVGLTVSAPLHARHDAGADPAHQRACVVLAWTKAVQAAAVSPPLALHLPAALSRVSAAERRPLVAELASPAPSARGPPAV